MTLTKAPKLFISYSWSSPSHEAAVIGLAEDLVESGVDVILDKWDLSAGHDALAFMEKMVTDPEITKVAMVCDSVYAAKADGRAGGVGTETQIISGNVYAHQRQEKFVAVVMENDAAGNPCLPAYYTSRIFIDLSRPELYADEFEKLLRWIFNRPLHKKPEIGKMPSFLEEADHVSLGTAAAAKRCLDAIKNDRSFSSGTLDEYCNIFTANLGRFRIAGGPDDFDETVVRSINDLLTARNEFIVIVTTISQYAPKDAFVARLHRFFEGLVPYMHRPSDLHGVSYDADYDNFKFLVHELLLYTLAIFLRHDLIELATVFLRKPYYIPVNSGTENEVMRGVNVFFEHITSLEHRKARLQSNRTSIRADLLKERSIGSGIEFHHLMQADFVLFMHCELTAENEWHGWWPETLVYLEHRPGPFEIFARSVSAEYFDRSKGLLGINAKQDLEPLMEAYRSHKRRLPQWHFSSVNPSLLLGLDKLATKP